MPNHVTNRITGPTTILDRLTRPATGDDAPAHNITTDGRVIDFNLLIPEPENNDDWYDWRVNHWGTKWNAYTPTITTHNDGTVTIGFQTAWSAPTAILTELSLRLPGEELHVQWADEDFGYNIGDVIMRNGVATSNNTLEERTDAARDYATNLCHSKTYAEYEAAVNAEYGIEDN